MSKTVEATIEMGGKVVATVSEDSIALSGIKIGLHQLKMFMAQGSSPVPEETAWKIRMYEFILNSKNPADLADQYMRARHPEKGEPDFPMPRNERQVCKKLGWDIK
jgi:hypothetical protein